MSKLSPLLVFLLFCIALPAQSAGPQFTDVTQAAGIDFVNAAGSIDKQYIIETQAAGGGFWDYDLDGRLDLFLTGGARPDSTAGTALYRGLGEGRFNDETTRTRSLIHN